MIHSYFQLNFCFHSLLELRSQVLLEQVLALLLEQVLVLLLEKEVSGSYRIISSSLRYPRN